MWLFTLSVNAAPSAITDLDDKSTTLLIALLILALIAAIVNGAYAIYMRKMSCSGTDVKKQAMRVWKEKKRQLENEVREDLQEEVQKTETKKIKQKIQQDLQEQMVQKQAQADLEIIEEIEQRIDDELEALKKHLKHTRSNDA